MSCNRLNFVMQRLCETERQTEGEAGRLEAPCWTGTQLQQHRKLGLRDSVCVWVCVCQAAEASRNNGSFLFQLQASCADTLDRNTHRLVRRGVRWSYDLRWGFSACCSATPACPAAQSVVSMDQHIPPCGSPPRRWSLISTSWGCVGRLNQPRWEVCTHPSIRHPMLPFSICAAVYCL